MHTPGDPKSVNSIPILQLMRIRYYATKRLRASCIDDIMLWSLSMRLKLNPGKSELIWFDRSSKLYSVLNSHSLLTSSLLSPSSTVWDLGVILDSTLSLKLQIAAISRACLFHLRRILQFRSTLDSASLKTLIHYLILTRLDYCNSILYGLPECTLLPLTASDCTTVSSTLLQRPYHTCLRSVHWLPVCERIRFKLALLMHRADADHLTSYLSSVVTPCNSVTGHSSIQSASAGMFVEPGTEHFFDTAGRNLSYIFFHEDLNTHVLAFPYFNFDTFAGSSMPFFSLITLTIALSLSFSLSLFLSFSLSLFLSVCLSLCSLSVCLSALSLSVSLPASLSVCLSLCVCLSMSVCLSACLSLWCTLLGWDL